MTGFAPPPVFQDENTSERPSKRQRVYETAKDVDDKMDDTTQDVEMVTLEPAPKTAATSSKDRDPLSRIPGMYRLLDLISEQSSGGTVDKIIIDQISLENFINDVHPGAYQSLTRVDFRVLDQQLVMPIGIYGFKSEIVALLVSLGLIDLDYAQRITKEGETGLRSGLYVVKSQDLSLPCHVIYWPEETTWNDETTSSIRRNRITFMRYLSKITHQIVCLVPSTCAATLVWKDDEFDTEIVEDETFDRLFTFEVSKTSEQEENVVMRSGFEMKYNGLRMPDEQDLPETALDTSIFGPRLLAGEKHQAFTTVTFSPATETKRNINNESHNSTKLTYLIEKGCLISPGATEETIVNLVDHGLGRTYHDAVSDWRQRKSNLKKNTDDLKASKMAAVKADTDRQDEENQSVMQHAILEMIADMYPTLDKANLTSIVLVESRAHLEDTLQSYFTIYPVVKAAYDAVKVPPITSKRYKTLKERIIGTKLFLDSHPELETDDRTEFLELMLTSESLEQAVLKMEPQKSGFWASVKEWLSPSSKAEMYTQTAHKTSNKDFVAALQEYVEFEPQLEVYVKEVIDIVMTYFRGVIKTQSNNLFHKAKHAIIEGCQVQVTREVSGFREKEERESRNQLITDIEKANEGKRSQLHIDTVSRSKTAAWCDFLVHGCMTQRNEPSLSYYIHPFQISQDDQQNLKMDATFVPAPHVNERLNLRFKIPLGYRILHFQMVESDRFLLVLDDGKGSINIFIEKGISLDGAISRNFPKKTLHQDKIGKDLLVAYDEQRRLLLICASAKLQLHLFYFDETFSTLSGWGSAVNLVTWYSHTASISITQACFVSGTEEIFLLDSTAEGRIFSLVSQQCRPASIKLQKPPIAVCSSPDGACLFLAYPGDDSTLVYAYHWSALGSSEPVIHNLPFVPSGPLLLTSITNRGSIHLIGLDLEAHLARSFVFDITTKVAEFQFREQHARTAPAPELRTFHNCLIECHADVWIRFPVVAAIQHHISGTAGHAVRRRLIFATDRDYSKFAPHFSSMIQAFEQKTRKPTDNTLREIDVSAFPLRDLLNQMGGVQVSSFMLGEWLVAFLCLIPIHIAVTRDNRFLPLKDGVVSPEWEKTLLGAEVGKIVDSVSLGWYESIFQSYMSHKPVKVVSSMGEQSVGKSYSLNHFVDSSFAGSAMRTTEGVWLSCTPTDDALIVALDFEGVHSIERSAQEDTLLVLFNTAISNLVLFRNNFALSRDITGLFQSFQSSSNVLDPKANPTLFQSTLVIIIKDVVDSDKTEIVNEFSLKFQKIVQEEQDANFISRLHAGRLNIIPWPVIESRNFYSLFQALRKRLDQQTVTHPAAGQFLLTLKTLMAKLKANDWGSISQTLVAHRVQRLLALLPNALMYGLSEVLPQEEPLKNLDSDELINEADFFSAHPYFWLDAYSGSVTREDTLLHLARTWSKFSLRDEMIEADYIAGLSAHLHILVERRIELVKTWIDSNLARFTASHASVSDLRREFDKLQVDLKTGVELCRMKCSACNLLCVGNRRHEADTHDCQTSHQCSKPCDYTDEHADGIKTCGYIAGHSGSHICAVDTHLCGRPCELESKRGCLGECTKMVGHSDSHLCPSKVHACGQPCSLKDVRLPNGKKYSCTDKCSIASDYGHDDHICESQMCPMTCHLCKRLCSTADHFHAMDKNAVHLCGQDHSCSALCSAHGTCEIETAPQSIKATFTGRHETFEYTKYSQVAKRLKCAIIIPSGELEHTGAHIHSTDSAPFHFCETQCQNCGYYCTLPLGHAQQVHETSHGSMSKSRWAIDGPAGTTVEVDGHKYGSDDDGAPMMCSLVCANMGRHAHLDYCRTPASQTCQTAEVQHVERTRFNPNPERAKDWISHSLFWRRSGFKDPYSRDDQANFAKCDAMCPGPEHSANANAPAQPSYCTLSLFHMPQTSTLGVGLGYLSHDGHVFTCKNPAVLQQAFHVIFVVDRSSSMSSRDRTPLRNTPVTALIQRTANNRLGAVYSALYGFWASRHAATNTSGQAATPATNRRDAYSVILFDDSAKTVISNDFSSSPRALLDSVLRYETGGGTNFSGALDAAMIAMRQNWSTERAPIVVFLSDGECSLPDNKVQDICRAAITLGKPLSLHTVAFGVQYGVSILRRMVQIALEIQNNAPVDPNVPANSRVESSFSEALDSVRLADTFLGIAESLRKPRGALMQN